MAAYYFRAVAPDGKLRTGTLNADTEKWVAQELRKQGLTPVYVGTGQKKSLDLKMPVFNGGKRRDVLFFTQELSTLLNAGVPLDRALSITSELTERAHFRIIVSDVIRVLKGGKSGPAIIPGQPEQSLLIQAVAHRHATLRMPPAGELEPQQVADLERWVRDGAAWPESKPQVAAGYVITPQQKAFWSFQPVRKVEPPAVDDATWSRNPMRRRSRIRG